MSVHSTQIKKVSFTTTYLFYQLLKQETFIPLSTVHFCWLSFSEVSFTRN